MAFNCSSFDEAKEKWDAAEAVYEDPESTEEQYNAAYDNFVTAWNAAWSECSQGKLVSGPRPKKPPKW